MLALKDHLHDLHEAAGCPTANQISTAIGAARKTPASRATVHKALCGPGLPARATVVAIVGALSPLAVPPRDAREETPRVVALWERANRAARQRKTGVSGGSAGGRSRLRRGPDAELESMETGLRMALAKVSQGRHEVDATRDRAARDSTQALWAAREQAQRILDEARSEAQRIEDEALREHARLEIETHRMHEDLVRLRSERSRLMDRVQGLDLFRADTEAMVRGEQRLVLRRVDEFEDRRVPDDVPAAEPLPDLEAVDVRPFDVPRARGELASTGPNASMA